MSQPPAFALQARGLRKTYGKEAAKVEALRSVDVDIRIGEFTSIMGPSGSGKSTLLHLLGLLDAPTGGAIRVMGHSTARYTANQRALARRQHLGFVFQAFHLLPRASALQNVLLPMALAGTPRRHRMGRAEQVLRAVGLEDRMHHRPSELSGGQKQRVAIARALALDPPILLADEPTGNLDSRTGQEIMRLFQELNRRGKTIVQVTHAPEMAAFGRRVIHVRDGRLAAPARAGAVARTGSAGRGGSPPRSGLRQHPDHDAVPATGARGDLFRSDIKGGPSSADRRRP